MARTRWPPGPVNPGLLPRPGRSDRQRRWVPKAGARPTDRYQDSPSGVGRFGGQAGTRSRPYAHITAKPQKRGRSTYPHPPCRLFVLRWNGVDGASMLRSSNSARSRPGATRHARRLLPHATYLLGVRTGSYPGSALCVALGVAQGLDPCADAPVHLRPPQPFRDGVPTWAQSSGSHRGPSRPLLRWRWPLG